MPRRRASRIALAVLLGVAFVGVSVLLASALTAPGRERSAVLDLVRAQARGDAGAMLARLPQCARTPACRSGIERMAGELRRDGRIEVLRYDPSAQLVLTGARGEGRIAWRAGQGTPVVQCVRIRRTGPLEGSEVELLTVSRPVQKAGPCGD